MVSRRYPANSGKTPKARFCSISIIPKPVPSSLGEMSMGIVGTIMAQNMAMQMPRRKEGTQRKKAMVLKSTLASSSIMKKYVKVKKQQEAISTKLRLETLSTK